MGHVLPDSTVRIFSFRIVNNRYLISKEYGNHCRMVLSQEFRTVKLLAVLTNDRNQKLILKVFLFGFRVLTFSIAPESGNNCLSTSLGKWNIEGMGTFSDTWIVGLGVWNTARILIICN